MDMRERARRSASVVVGGHSKFLILVRAPILVSASPGGNPTLFRR
jgi:hypothetical protein